MALAVVLIRNRKRSEQSTVHTVPPDTSLPMRVLSPDVATWEVIDGVTIKERLGGGSFGEVYRGEWSGVSIALKMLKSRDDLNTFENEANLLQQCRHPCITQYLGIYTNSGVKYIVTEYLSHGSLDVLLRAEKTNISHLDLLALAKDAANGMSFLEKKRILHRDLAARNVLVTTRDGKYHAKIADFGLTRALGNDKDYYSASDPRIAVKWSAVEVIGSRKFSTASDVWSFGVTLWEMYSYGGIPYPGLSNVQCMDQVNSGYRMPPPPNCPEEISSIIMLCWKDDPKKRPSFAAITRALESLATTPEVELVASLETATEPQTQTQMQETEEIKPDLNYGPFMVSKANQIYNSD